MSSPLHLRQVSRDAAAYWRQLARRRQALPFTWLDGQWQVRFQPLALSRDGLTSLTIDWGGVPVVARVDDAWIGQIGRQVLQVDDLRQVPASLQPMVVEAAFEGLAELIEAVTRKRFSLLGIEGTSAGRPACQYGIGFELDDGDASASGELWFDDTGLAYLAAALRQLPAAIDEQDWRALPISLTFSVGRTTLPLSSLRALNRRDVVLLDESWAGGELDRIMVMVGRMGAAAAVSGRHVTILEELGDIMEDLDDQGPEEGAAFGDLPVRLCFDLGERQLTLAELMTMGPGHVFDLGRELRRAVIIRANGRAIGEGELVDVDGQIGVAVLSLSPPERE